MSKMSRRSMFGLIGAVPLGGAAVMLTGTQPAKAAMSGAEFHRRMTDEETMTRIVENAVRRAMDRGHYRQFVLDPGHRHVITDPGHTHTHG